MSATDRAPMLEDLASKVVGRVRLRGLALIDGAFWPGSSLRELPVF